MFLRLKYNGLKQKNLMRNFNLVNHILKWIDKFYQENWNLQKSLWTLRENCSSESREVYIPYTEPIPKRVEKVMQIYSESQKEKMKKRQICLILNKIKLMSKRYL